MAARARSRALVALVSAALLSAYALFFLPAPLAVPDAHGRVASATVGHDDADLADIAGPEEPESHCHPGIDCLLPAMILQGHAAVAFHITASVHAAPSEDRFRSISMSPQPPPPRAG